jgi:hypothetical protein
VNDGGTSGAGVPESGDVFPRSSRRWLFVVAVLGAVVPYGFFLPWVLTHGPDIPLLVGGMFGDRISAFAWADVIIAALVTAWLGLRMVLGGRRRGWIVVAASLLVGVSCALPLYLALRQPVGDNAPT